MATRISNASRNAAVAAIAALVDGGAGAGTIKVYSGAQPATAETAASGTLLATFTLNDPAFAVGATGVQDLDVSPALSTTGVAAGDVGWFRLESSTPGTVLDGSATATGGGGQLELSTATVSIGLTVSITSGTITMPAA